MLFYCFLKSRIVYKVLEDLYLQSVRRFIDPGNRFEGQSVHVGRRSGAPVPRNVSASEEREGVSGGQSRARDEEKRRTDWKQRCSRVSQRWAIVVFLLLADWICRNGWTQTDIRLIQLTQLFRILKGNFKMYNGAEIHFVKKQFLGVAVLYNSLAVCLPEDFDIPFFVRLIFLFVTN